MYTVAGTFLGQPVSGQTIDPAEFKTQLIGNVVRVTFTTSSVSDLGGAVQKRIREGIFNRLSDADAITKVTLRDSINATASSWLMGGVIASGNGELEPYPNPCTPQAVSVNNDILTLNYIASEKTFVYRPRPTGRPCSRRAPWPKSHAGRRKHLGRDLGRRIRISPWEF
jgi:hypothetical protein